MDHIISELDLEYKTDEDSNIFLTRLKYRQDHLRYRSKHRKNSDNFLIGGLVSKADILENIEKELMKLKGEFDEYMDVGRRLSSLHNNTEIDNIKEA